MQAGWPQGHRILSRQARAAHPSYVLLNFPKGRSTGGHALTAVRVLPPLSHLPVLSSCHSPYQVTLSIPLPVYIPSLAGVAPHLNTCCVRPNKGRACHLMSAPSGSFTAPSYHQTMFFFRDNLLLCEDGHGTGEARPARSASNVSFKN